jgi:hypothetical protein
MPATAKKTAKKTTSRKPAAKKTAAKQPAAKITVPEMPKADEVADRVEDVMTDAVKFVREAAHTYIGFGIAVQDRFVRRGATDKAKYPNFLEEAKAKGHARVTEIQDRFEPIAKRIEARFEPVTERFESRLPKPVKEVIDDGRDRVRHILAV